MVIRQFEPGRSLEIIAPSYGSAYRIGGGLVLTAAHLLGEVGSDCEVRDKRGVVGRAIARVVWKARNADIAMIELPEKVVGIGPIGFGQLPPAQAGEVLEFQMYGYPAWGHTQRDGDRTAAGRLHIKGEIYLGDESADDYLVLEPTRLPSEVQSFRQAEGNSVWAGCSGAVVFCQGLAIAIQSQHQRPDRAASLEAESLERVYADATWQRLLWEHGINPEPELIRLAQNTQPLERDWHQIGENWLNSRLQLTTNPMTRGQAISYEVAQVFVPLGLLERRKVPRRQDDGAPDVGSRLYGEEQQAEREQVEVTKQFEHEEFLEEVLGRGESPKSQGRRVAIIGEPGAGKTTLLQQTGRWLIERFPESLVIWVTLADLQGDRLEAYLENRWLQGVIRDAGAAEVSATDRANFAEQFQRGRVWLLLDGVDEMQAGGNGLTEIQRQILEGGWLRQARIVLTCRLNLWDGDRNTLQGFDTYRTLDFSYPQQVELFIERWFAPQGKAEAGTALCAALRQPGRERIQDLVKNPLRLVLLCFSWSSSQRQALPETQAGLYRQFVERIYAWKQEEFPTTLAQRRALNGALAELSREAMDGQGGEGYRFRLRQGFVQRYLSGDLFDLALRLGWLNRVGIDERGEVVYAFYHLTFEEYFAALAIEDWGFFLPRNHRNRPVKGGRYRVFESQWRQVFLLWLGREDEGLTEQKNELTGALTRFKDGCGDFYGDRAFLLSAAGLAEFKECEWGEAIVARLILWKFGHLNWLKRRWNALLNSGRTEAREAWVDTTLNRTDSQQLALHLVEFLRDSKIDAGLRVSAADILGQIDVGNETAIAALVGLLQDSKIDANIRQQAANSLGQIAVGNETTIAALVGLLQDSKVDADMLFNVANSLGQIAVGNETAITTLVGLLQDSKIRAYKYRAAKRRNRADKRRIYSKLIHAYIQYSAANGLGQIDVGNETAITTLVGLLQDVKINTGIRDRAANSLGQIAVGNETAITTLVGLLQDSKIDAYTRYSAANSLGQIDAGNETAIATLVGLLQDSKIDTGIQYRAANILGQIDAGNKTAIATLVGLLQDSKVESYISYSVANIVCQIAVGNETAIATLVGLLQDSKIDAYIRYEAADILGQIAVGNETAIATLVGLLQDSKIDADIRYEAADSLGQIGTGDENMRRSIVQCLRHALNPRTERAIIQLMMQCAETLPYPTFHQAFHTPRWPWQQPWPTT